MWLAPAGQLLVPVMQKHGESRYEPPVHDMVRTVIMCKLIAQDGQVGVWSFLEDDRSRTDRPLTKNTKVAQQLLFFKESVC